MEEINKIYTSDTANSFSNGAMMGAMLGNNDRNDALTAMLAKVVISRCGTIRLHI